MSVRRLASGGPWEQIYGYSRVVVAGPWIITAGCTSTVNGEVAHVGDAYRQAKEAFRAALDGIVAAGGSLSDVVRTRMYVVGDQHADAVGRAHGEMFGVLKPVATLVVVAALLHADHLVEVEVEAYRP